MKRFFDTRVKLMLKKRTGMARMETGWDENKNKKKSGYVGEWREGEMFKVMVMQKRSEGN